MRPRELKCLDKEWTEYVESLRAGLGRPERRRAMGWYVQGLLLEGERKSVQPMAARLVETEIEAEAMRQRLQQCVVVSDWNDDLVRARLAQRLDRELPGVEAFVIDDTGFPKKGTHSVGVARQYSGTLGGVENCQVATSLHLAAEGGSACIGMQMYLPKEWTEDPKRCHQVGVPKSIPFRTKPTIALDLLDRALEHGIRKHLVLADAGYGDSREFRTQIRTRGLHYLVAVAGSHTVWPPGVSPKRPPRTKRSGRPATRYRAEGVEPQTLQETAASLEFQQVSWRAGSRGTQTSWFAAVRLRSAEKHPKKQAPGEEEWLLCEWPAGKEEPSKFYFSSLPPSSSLHKLVRLAKLRWRVERDYQELKQEIGLDHWEGRNWRGFHHHVTLCAVAHAFLVLRRAIFPPQLPRKLDTSGRSCGAPASPRASHREMPMLSTNLRSRDTTSRTLENVIK